MVRASSAGWAAVVLGAEWLGSAVVATGVGCVDGLACGRYPPATLPSIQLWQNVPRRRVHAFQSSANASADTPFRSSHCCIHNATLPSRPWLPLAVADTRALLRPDVDDRQYEHLTLPNGLQALLVSDPTTDKAAAAMDVNVGHLCDPEEAAGLAHFCEHLLFMGNEKYPSENEYNQYLAAHGGYSNAFTGTDSTNYYFEVVPNFLEGAFDRFIQFFISPLFDESCTEREMKAVDSEHKKNLQLDNWRIYQLQKDLSSKDHPYHKFGTGNLKTLKDIPLEKGIDIRKVLLEFHSKYYSANIMRLVILGREPIDVLKQWVVEKTASIKNLGIEPPSFPGHPLSAEFLGTELLVKPVKNIPSLELMFPLPDLTPFYKSRPSSYLSHLIGHESEGSILALLKKRGWAQSLMAGAYRGGINFEFFQIRLSLTEDGFRNWKEIVVIIFQYIKMLNEVGVQKWIFDECQVMSNISFRYKEKSSPSNFASRVAGQMQHYPPEHVLSGPSVLLEFDKQKVEEVLAALRPDNFRVTVVSPYHDEPEWKSAAWYGTEYISRPLSADLKENLANLSATPELHLPERNEFIPENLTLKAPSAVHSARPAIVSETPTVRMWYKKDDQFKVPKAKAFFSLRTPLAYSTPATCVMTRLYTDLLEDALNQYSYYADVAGLSYSIENNTEGLELHVLGYNDKLPRLIEHVFRTMKSLHINPDRFKAIKEHLGHLYKDWKMDAPHQHASYYGSYVTQEKLWTSEEKLEALNDITAADISSFYPQLLSRLFVEGLVVGNYDAQEAASLAALVDKCLTPSAFPSSVKEVTMRTLQIPSGSKVVLKLDVPNVNQPNSAIEYNVQVGDVANDLLRVKTLLLSQIAREPCFDILRTKEQLGYIVFSGLRKQTGMIGFRIIIQSERDPWVLEERILAFLSTFKEMLESLTDEQYSKHINALVSRLTEKDKNLNEEANRWWSHIASRYYDFQQNLRDAETVKSLSKSELVEFFKTAVDSDSKDVRKISVHLRSHSLPKAAPEAIAKADESEKALAPGQKVIGIDDVALFRMGLSLGPDLAFLDYAMPYLETVQFRKIYFPPEDSILPIIERLDRDASGLRDISSNNYVLLDCKALNMLVGKTNKLVVDAEIVEHWREESGLDPNVSGSQDDIPDAVLMQPFATMQLSWGRQIQVEEVNRLVLVHDAADFSRLVASLHHSLVTIEGLMLHSETSLNNLALAPLPNLRNLEIQLKIWAISLSV
ncbi:Insulinase (Peptidase M16) [Phlyctochytrium bullatum]|nr:Insulinase (Peptidase M16) [Phlyctochytrium bullatum]